MLQKMGQEMTKAIDDPFKPGGNALVRWLAIGHLMSYHWKRLAAALGDEDIWPSEEIERLREKTIDERGEKDEWGEKVEYTCELTIEQHVDPTNYQRVTWKFTTEYEFMDQQITKECNTVAELVAEICKAKEAAKQAEERWTAENEEKQKRKRKLLAETSEDEAEREESESGDKEESVETEKKIKIEEAEREEKK